MVLHSTFCFTLLFVMCYRMCDLAGDNFTNGVQDGISDMVWVCYSSSSTCLAFLATLLRLLLFAVLCHLLLWGHKTTLGWSYHPQGGGFIPQKGWLYTPQWVVLSPKRGGFIPLWWFCIFF